MLRAGGQRRAQISVPGTVLRGYRAVWRDGA